MLLVEMQILEYALGLPSLCLHRVIKLLKVIDLVLMYDSIWCNNRVLLLMGFKFLAGINLTPLFIIII